MNTPVEQSKKKTKEKNHIENEKNKVTFYHKSFIFMINPLLLLLLSSSFFFFSRVILAQTWHHWMRKHWLARWCALQANIVPQMYFYLAKKSPDYLYVCRFCGRRSNTISMPKMSVNFMWGGTCCLWTEKKMLPASESFH